MKQTTRSILTILTLAFILCCFNISQGFAGEASVQPWPSNGEIFHSDSAAGEQAALNISIGNLASGYAAMVKLCTVSGETVRCLFAGNTNGGSQSVQLSTSLPGGDYILKIGVGTNWYGRRTVFGAEGTYSRFLLDDNQSVIPLEAGYPYTLYIDAAPGSCGASCEAISYNGF